MIHQLHFLSKVGISFDIKRAKSPTKKGSNTPKLSKQKTSNKYKQYFYMLRFDLGPNSLFVKKELYVKMGWVEHLKPSICDPKSSPVQQCHDSWTPSKRKKEWPEVQNPWAKWSLHHTIFKSTKLLSNSATHDRSTNNIRWTEATINHSTKQTKKTQHFTISNGLVLIGCLHSTEF